VIFPELTDFSLI